MEDTEKSRTLRLGQGPFGRRRNPWPLELRPLEADGDGTVLISSNPILFFAFLLSYSVASKEDGEDGFSGDACFSRTANTISKLIGRERIFFFFFDNNVDLLAAVFFFSYRVCCAVLAEFFIGTKDRRRAMEKLAFYCLKDGLISLPPHKLVPWHFMGKYS